MRASMAWQGMAGGGRRPLARAWEGEAHRIKAGTARRSPRSSRGAVVNGVDETPDTPANHRLRELAWTIEARLREVREALAPGSMTESERQSRERQLDGIAIEAASLAAWVKYAFLPNADRLRDRQVAKVRKALGY
ncbi:MAG: hypothetical protein ACHREM_00910 [Polyangiales bacterium]